MSKIIEVERLEFCPACGSGHPELCELLGHFYPLPPSAPFRVSAIIEATLPEPAPASIGPHPDTGASFLDTTSRPVSPLGCEPPNTQLP